MKLQSRNRYQNNGESYTMRIWVDVLSNAGTITGTLYEYANKGDTAPTKSIAIFSILDTLDIENFETIYTASESWYSIEIECTDDAVVQIADMRKKEDNII